MESVAFDDTGENPVVAKSIAELLGGKNFRSFKLLEPFGAFNAGETVYIYYFSDVDAVEAAGCLNRKDKYCICSENGLDSAVEFDVANLTICAEPTYPTDYEKFIKKFGSKRERRVIKCAIDAVDFGVIINPLEDGGWDFVLVNFDQYQQRFTWRSTANEYNFKPINCHDLNETGRQDLERLFGYLMDTILF